MIIRTLKNMAKDTAKILKDLDLSNIDYELIEHEKVVTILDVLRVLKLDVRITAKTIVFDIKNYGTIAVVISGDKGIDYKAIIDLLGLDNLDSIKLMDKQRMQNLGLQIGGISPMSGIYDKIIFDAGLVKNDFIYCGVGANTLTIKINPLKLARDLNANIYDVAIEQKKETKL